MATQSVPPTVLIDKLASSLLDQILDKLVTLNIEDLQRVEAAVDRLSSGQSLVGLDRFTPAPAA